MLGCGGPPLPTAATPVTSGLEDPDATAPSVIAAACDFIKSLCITGLRLRGRTALEIIATSLLLLHRHLHRAPVAADRDAALMLAAASVHLAGKIRDAPRHLADTVAHYLLTVKGVAAASTAERDVKARVEAEEAIVRAERQLLHWCGYDVEVPSPWPPFEAACGRVDPPLSAIESDLATRTMNELLTMPSCVRWPVQALADAAVFLGATKGGEAWAHAVAASALSTPLADIAAIRQALLAHEQSRRRPPPTPAARPAAAGAGAGHEPGSAGGGGGGCGAGGAGADGSAPAAAAAAAHG